MPIDNDIYSIYAVRLVNFHNINHVTLPIRDGGHLFLLGDNGSGKTTVLDAIHYVLSAGEQVELNSAARLGGNKLDGRRINGVVTRVNVDTGPLCPEGRVTYAALELRNGAGHVQTIGIGLSMSGETAPLSQWGFMTSAPVTDLPLLVSAKDRSLLEQDDSQEEYPPDREEFKRLIQKQNGHYYQTMTGFANALVKAFFPGRSHYAEYRKFLNMCKAYREISSRAGNYHELFRSLLPEPEQELIQELRLKLRALRESSADLNALEKKCLYLRELHADKVAVDKLRNDLQILELGLRWFERETKQRLLRKANEKEKVLEVAMNRAQELSEQTQSDLESLERSLTDLRSNDDINIVETAKARSLELQNMDAQMTKLTQRKDDVQQTQAQLEQSSQTTRQNLQKNLGDLAGKLAANLEAWQGLPLEPALKAVQDAQKTPECPLDAQPLHALSNAFGGVQERERTRLEELAARMRDAKEAQIDAEKTLAELQKQREIFPLALPDYSSVLQELDQQFLPASPLYLKLHWKAEVTPEQRATLEEIIGEAVLGTLVAEHEVMPKIRALLLAQDRRGYRCADLDSTAPTPPPAVYRFLNQFFDSSRDASYLNVLARELDGSTVPEPEANNPIRFVDWRGSFRVLQGMPARLIGEEERQAERERQLQLAKDACQQATADLKAAEAKKSAQEKRIQTLGRFAERCNALFNELEEAERTLQMILQNQRQQEEKLDSMNHDLKQLGQERQQLAQLIEQLRQQIADKNLEALNAEITKLTQRLAKAKKTHQDARDQWLLAQNDCRNQQQDCEHFKKEAEEAAETLRQALAASTVCHSEEALCKHLKDATVSQRDECEKQRILLQQHVARHQGTITTRINADQGVDYGFVYQEEDNQLFSREHITLEELLARLETELAQQRDILNENTRANFERILLELFRDSLRKRIFSLEHMHTLINRMLKGHVFGNNTYSLKLQPLPDYKPLVGVIRSFSDQLDDSAEQLKDIFDKHSHDILETPANRIPDILDYRNYYRYEMLLHTPGTDGRVMDSRAKSVGSGGEQAVPNYLLVMMIAHLLFDKIEGTQSRIRINCLLFDEAFYGIDQQRQDQLLAFAEDLGLQLVIASPNQDGIKPELAHSTNVFVIKDKNYDVHLRSFAWNREQELFQDDSNDQLAELT